MKRKFESVLTMYTLLIIAVIVKSPVFSTSETTTYVQTLDASEKFNLFKGNPGIRLVYFYKAIQNKESYHHQKLFLEQYEKSAQLIKTYDVEFAKVNCPMKGANFCDRPKIEHQVIVFRNGLELMSLDLENMFDIDSIVSNVLQLVLLKDVPIVQKAGEKEMYLSMCKEKSDVLFSYQSAIGTHAHRIFMEIAFAYQSKYKFALTTESSIVSDMQFYNNQDESAIWLLRCKEVADMKQDCTAYKYWDNMDLMSLAKFIKVIDKPLIHDVTKDGKDNPFPQMGLHTVTIFYDDYKNVMTNIYELLHEFYGLIGILLVHVGDVKATEYGYDYGRMRIPTVTFQYYGETLLSIMPYDMRPSIFVNNHLSSIVKGFEKKTRDGIPVSQVYKDDTDIPDEDSAITDDMTPQEVARMNELEQIETQDDHVAATLWKMRKVKIDRTHLPALTDKTFYKEVKEKELLVVLFYLKFDARSMAFLHNYAAASHELAESNLHPLAGVDCFDWTDVCGKINVTSYPTINIYRKGEKHVPYKGMLSQKAMVSTVHLFLAKSPVHLKNEDEYKNFINGQVPENILQHTDISVLGLFTKEQEELMVFKELAAKFEGKLLFAYFTGDIANKIATGHSMKLPSVIVHKRHDNIKPQAVFNDVFNQEKLSDFIFNQALAVFPELSVANLPAYMSKKKPFVILFTNKAVHPESQDAISEIAKSEQFPDIIFCWMNVTNPKSLASRILAEYSPVASSPAISLVNHQLGSVHNYNGVEFSQSSVTTWIKDVMDKAIEPSKMLGNREWKPRHPGYDFLKMIEEEEQRKKYNENDIADGDPESEVDTFQGKSTAQSNDIPDAKVREELKILRDGETDEQRSTRWRNIEKSKKDESHKHQEL